jgi:hypothetical protein
MAGNDRPDKVIGREYVVCGSFLKSLEAERRGIGGGGRGDPAIC